MIRQWISIQGEEIGSLAGLDRAGLRGEPHHLRGHGRRRPQRVDRRKARQHVELELAVQAVIAGGDARKARPGGREIVTDALERQDVRPGEAPPGEQEPASPSGRAVS